MTTSVAASASEVEVIRYAVSLPSDAQGATKVHFPQRHKIPATVVITYDGPAAGSSATFPATVVITVIGTAGADVIAKLSGPDVQATSVSGTTGTTVTLAFNVQAR